MNERDYLIILYDYYGDLLSVDNRRYFEDYYFDNLSLAEIAQNDNVSRNNVHKHLKSCEEKLLFYEEKLGLYKKDKLLEQKVNDIKDENMRKLIEEILK
jgi:predicted DNA-binding protein YlxM (UPF0122 family)